MGKRILVGLLLLFVLAGCLASCGTVAIEGSVPSPTPSAAPPEAIIVEGKLVTSSGATFAYQLALPASWMGRYEVREEGSRVAFDYGADPDHKETVFSLAALTEAEWQQEQDMPEGGRLLFRVDRTVFTLNSVALANMYVENEAEAEEFHAMVGQVQGILKTLKVTPVPR